MEQYDERFIQMRHQLTGLGNALKFHVSEREKDTQRIARLEEQVADLSNRNLSLTQQVAILRATTAGNGPTVR